MKIVQWNKRCKILCIYIYIYTWVFEQLDVERIVLFFWALLIEAEQSSAVFAVFCLSISIAVFKLWGSKWTDLFLVSIQISMVRIRHFRLLLHFFGKCKGIWVHVRFIKVFLFVWQTLKINISMRDDKVL